MAQSSVVVTVSLAWWLPVYLRSLAAFCALTEREPNWDKVNYSLYKAVRVKPVSRKRRRGSRDGLE